MLLPEKEKGISLQIEKVEDMTMSIDKKKIHG